MSYYINKKQKAGCDPLKKESMFTESQKREIIDAIHTGIGNNVSEIFRTHEIDEEYANSTGDLKWDCINKNLKKVAPSIGLSAEYAKRGPRKILPLIDIEKGMIYFFMKRSRFRDLARRRNKRENPHYIDAFAQEFNFDVENPQISFYGPSRFGSDAVNDIVSSVFASMRMGKGIVNKCAVILYDEYNRDLTSVACCLIDSELNIVEEERWSRLINSSMSVVVETISADEIIEPEVPKPAFKKNKREQRIANVQYNRSDEKLLGQE